MMSSQTRLEVVVTAVEDHMEAYWAKKLPRLQKLLVPYHEDVQEIRLTVYCHQQSPGRYWYEARAVIQLPTGTLVAEAADKDFRAALDEVADTLAKEIKRHKGCDCLGRSEPS
jgi:ribosomal subunit interface protein